MMRKVLLAEARAKALLPVREKTSYKNQFGHALLIGGNENLGGAIQMAAQAAVYAGSGLVTVATDPVNRAAIHAAVPEAMVIDWNDERTLVRALQRADVIAIGPGLGLSLARWRYLTKRITQYHRARALVIDGDAITQYAADAQDGHAPLFHDATVIFTPHPGEWRRLANGAIDAADVDAIQRWVTERQAVLVLKGAPTRIFASDHDFYYENTTGNPGQATGGMGDTLVGTIAAMCGQIEAPFDAAIAGVFLHSYAADRIYENAAIVVPTVLAHALPQALKMLSR